MAKELRSRKKLLFLNFSWFEKSIELSTRKFEILSDVRLSLPSHLLSQYVTTLAVPHFYYYKYKGAFFVLKSKTYFLVRHYYPIGIALLKRYNCFFIAAF